MTRHAHQHRPIRGRRFDRGRFVGTLILILALVGGVLFWWSAIVVVVSLTAGWPR